VDESTTDFILDTVVFPPAVTVFGVKENRAPYCWPRKFQTTGTGLVSRPSDAWPAGLSAMPKVQTNYFHLLFYRDVGEMGEGNLRGIPRPWVEHLPAKS